MKYPLTIQKIYAVMEIALYDGSETLICLYDNEEHAKAHAEKSTKEFPPYRYYVEEYSLYK